MDRPKKILFNNQARWKGGVHRVHVHPQFFGRKDCQNLLKFADNMYRPVGKGGCTGCTFTPSF